MKLKLLIRLSLVAGAAVAFSSCGLIAPLVRTALPFAGIKMAFACLPEEAMIDTPAGPRCIRDITAGDTVTGYRGQPVLVQQKHVYREQPETEFLRATFDDGATLEACGMHRIAGTRMRELEPGQVVAGRRVLGITSRRGIQRSYDLMTGDEGYRISGIPVNSMIEEMHAAAAGLPRGRD
jgi:hypothetical protein